MNRCHFFVGAVVLFCAGILGCAAGSDNAAECYFPAKYRLRSLPVFDSYLMTVKRNGGSRVDVYMLVPYGRIRFHKNGDGYSGSYTATCILRDNDSQPVMTREATRLLASANYEGAASSRFDAFLQSFDLAPGPYRCELTVVDDGSGLRSTVVKKITVPDFQRSEAAAGDFLLLEQANADARGVVLRPRFPSQLRGEGDSLGLFQEFYNLLPGDTLLLSLSYSADRIFSETGRMAMQPFVGELNYQEEKENDSSYYRRDSVCVVEKAGTMRVVQFFSHPQYGYNTFHRHIVVRRAGTETVIDQKRSWLVRHSVSAQTGLGAFAYIMHEEERDSLSIAATPAERIVRLSQFWETHGGTSKRQEFEERVREANDLFSYYAEGWRTPMGAAYIVCGTPDYVDCQGGLSEVWYYGVGNQVAAVTFRGDFQPDDEEPFYRLVPFSTNDIFWRACVDRWRRR